MGNKYLCLKSHQYPYMIDSFYNEKLFSKLIKSIHYHCCDLREHPTFGTSLLVNQRITWLILTSRKHIRAIYHLLWRLKYATRIINKFKL
jgi:hypothetical protein